MGAQAPRGRHYFRGPGLRPPRAFRGKRVSLEYAHTPRGGFDGEVFVFVNEFGSINAVTRRGCSFDVGGRGREWRLFCVSVFSNVSLRECSIGLFADNMWKLLFDRAILRTNVCQAKRNVGLALLRKIFVSNVGGLLFVRVQVGSFVLDEVIIDIQVLVELKYNYRNRSVVVIILGFLSKFESNVTRLQLRKVHLWS